MDKGDTDIIYGRNPVLEALENGLNIEKVLIHNTMSGPYEKQIRFWAKDRNIPLVKVPIEKLTAILGNKAHQGTLAYISPISYHDLDEWLEDKGDAAIKLLILDSITDVRNIGAIARSALVFGMDAIMISAKQAGRISADTVKASAGAILNIDMIRVGSTIRGLEELKQAGVTIVATDLNAKDYLQDHRFAQRSAVILGSEDKGIDRNLLPLADHILKIKQPGVFDSLNVSVAAGIVLYAWTQ